MTETLVTVGLGGRSYPIRIRSGLLHEVGADLEKRKIANRYAVISDDHVAGLYGDQLLRSLSQAGLHAEMITFPKGNSRKTCIPLPFLPVNLPGAVLIAATHS